MNSVNIIGNLTKDPELRHTPSGAAVCNMRVAVNDRRKQNDEWVDVPYYFDVTVWGKSGENCAQYLTKGSKIGVNGKLTWREWEAQDGTKRQSVEIEANLGGVTFLTPKNGGNGGGSSNHFVPAAATADAGGWGGFAGADDDIPF